LIVQEEGDRIEREKLVVIVGPTAVGKTEISIRIADQINGEIISGDSMQVYRGMDIGTAKVQEKEMISPRGRKIPHHLIDIMDPDANFSAADFQHLARKAIHEINGKGKIPLLVGGTGLYVNSVIDPYNFMEMEHDKNFRITLLDEAERSGPASLYHQLCRIDPEAAQRIHPNDVRRMIRAIEVFYQTGKTITELRSHRPDQSSPYSFVMIGLYLERDLLYPKINDRVDQMIKMGLIEEVSELLKKGYHPRLNSMQGLGYRQMAAYLTGILTKEEAIRLLKRDTRRFAKRQFTWFKRDERIKWYHITDFSEKTLCAEKITEYIGRTLGIPVE